MEGRALACHAVASEGGRDLIESAALQILTYGAAQDPRDPQGRTPA